jgi:uncharacterized RmlC-like cupin family protein
VMLYILEGHVRHEYGPDLRMSVENEAGDFIFIEPGVPHEVCNMSDTDPVVAVVARSDASEWEHIADYPSRRRPLQERLQRTAELGRVDSNHQLPD